MLQTPSKNTEEKRQTLCSLSVPTKPGKNLKEQNTGSTLEYQGLLDYN